MLNAIARPKVNLFLHVTGKRPDGYHLLESLVVFPNGGDEISIAPDRELSLEATGPFAGAVGAPDNNLILKAARALQSRCRIHEGAEISLVKNLPVAAGIGGGSADAAAALQLLNELWRLGLSSAQLAETGLALGADVPACLLGRPALMSGVGERLVEIERFPKFHIILVNCGILVSTAEVFERLVIPSTSASAFDFRGGTTEELFRALATCRNDLQTPAIETAPEIAAVLGTLERQEGCRLARMSGSGGTCFGLFETAAAAEASARQMQASQPGWWIYPTTVDD